MKERIKKIRKELDLTQQEFADRLGIKRGAIANYEIGRNDPVDSVISLICREFDVREEWLRNGEGKMFQTKPSDVLDQLAYKYQFSNMDYAIVEKYVSLSPQKRKEVIESVFGLFHEIEATLSDTDPYAPAYTGNEPPHPMAHNMEAANNQQETKATEMSVEQAEAEYIKMLSDTARNTEYTASNTTDGKKGKKAVG